MGMQNNAVVIDTNWVLDAWVFADARAAALRLAVEAGRVRWLATGAMRDELACVLDYPAVARWLARRGMGAEHAAQALAAFDAHARLVPDAPRAPIICRDADDQPFIDLAVQHGAALISHDAHITRLRRPLARLGVAVLRAWA